MRDELTDDQRARLCILEVLIDVTDTQIAGFDVLRCSHWVETGIGPDQLPDPRDRMRVWEPAVR